MTKLFSGIALAALVAAAPAFAETATKKLDPKQSAQSASQPANSGPGVQGPPGTRTGPSIKAPGEGSASEGASSGEFGSASSGASGSSSTEHTTQPSQDLSGVEGLPGNKSGKRLKEPNDEMKRSKE